jgi:hypothetical protein
MFITTANTRLTQMNMKKGVSVLFGLGGIGVFIP